MAETALHHFLNKILRTESYKVILLHTPGTNRHFKVESGRQKYFLKVFQTNELQVVSRQQQFQIQKQVALQALAPMPIALSECTEFWLEQWLPDAQSEHETPTDVRTLAMAMAKIHALVVDAEKLDLYAEWQRYLQLAGQDSQSYSDNIAKLVAQFEKHNELCFCHNDLHHSHVIAAEPFTILDWEYAALGNRYFDLAGCIQVNALSAAQTQIFLECYAFKTGLNLVQIRQRTQDMIPVVDFTAQLWNSAYNKLQVSDKS